MRVSQTEMDKSHQRIVDGASHLMRKHGIESTSVNDVMKKAGLTHGGFYRHFDSKEDLVSAALDRAFDEVIRVIEECYCTLGVQKGAHRYYEHYLSEEHLKHPELGCPIAALSIDVGRSTQPVKKSFSQGFNRAIEKLAQSGDKTEDENRAEVIRKISMLAGAIIIARACDGETAQAVMDACKNLSKL